jgi:hypothetical protein
MPIVMFFSDEEFEQRYREEKRTKQDPPNNK